MFSLLPCSPVWHAQHQAKLPSPEGAGDSNTNEMSTTRLPVQLHVHQLIRSVSGLSVRLVYTEEGHHPKVFLDQFKEKQSVSLNHGLEILSVYIFMQSESCFHVVILPLNFKCSHACGHTLSLLHTSASLMLIKKLNICCPPPLQQNNEL